MPSKGSRRSGPSASRPEEHPVESLTPQDPAGAASPENPHGTLEQLTLQVQELAMMVRSLQHPSAPVQPEGVRAIPQIPAPARVAPLGPQPSHMPSDVPHDEPARHAEQQNPRQTRWRRSLSPRSDEGSTPARSPYWRARTPPLKAPEVDLKELNQRIEALQGQMLKRGDILEFTTEPPFGVHILTEPLPKHFKVPQLETYDGTTDPVDHLQGFKTTMLLQGATDATLCRAFPATLKKSARYWYAGLKPNSIHSFEQLCKSFVAHFASSVKLRRSSDSLIHVKQKEGEALRTYVNRFTEAALEVYNLDQSVAMMAMRSGLRPSPFLFSLAKKPAQSLPDLLSRAAKYCSAEEVYGAYAPSAMFMSSPTPGVRPLSMGATPKGRNSAADPPSDRPNRKERLRSRSPRQPRPMPPHFRRHRGPEQAEPRPIQRFGPYTPLNAPQAEVLMQVRKEIPVPPKIRSDPKKRNPNKYCLYHRDHGHDTEECFQLRNEIEKLIRRGKLDRFLREPEERREATLLRLPEPPPSQEEAGKRPVREEVNAISGSPEGSFGTPKKSPSENITFTSADADGVQYPHHDPLVITLNVDDCNVHRVLVDTGSSVDILFYDAFVRMKVTSRTLQRVETILTGFEGRTVLAEGTITLPVIVGSAPRCSRINLVFTIVKIPSAYNAILGRPGLCALRAVESIYYLALKFPTPYGVGKVRGDQAVARQCYLVARQTSQSRRPEALPTDGLEVRDELTQERGEPAEDLIAIPLHDGNPEHTVQIGSGLDDAVKHELTVFLQENADIFAWAPADMPGIDPSVMTHHLRVDPGHRPVKQRKRTFAPERQRAIAEEVQRLLSANFIREVGYPEWLANAVLVKKANGKWRMCIDFTDLNKACPKDSFPLPRIDQMVDAMTWDK